MIFHLPGQVGIDMRMSKIIVFCSIVFIAGCASFAAREQLASLETALHTYEIAIRWGQHEAVKEFILDFEKQARNFKKFRLLKVTSYEVLSLKISESNVQAEQRVEINYYDPVNPVEKTLIDRQVWEYRKETKRWYLLSDFPDFK
jgi:hypothetical protein